MLPRRHVFGTSHLVPRLLTANLSSRYAQTLTGGADSITVKWSDFTESADVIAFKLCFHTDQIVDRPLRAHDDNIDNNKFFKLYMNAKSYMESSRILPPIFAP